MRHAPCRASPRCSRSTIDAGAQPAPYDADFKLGHAARPELGIRAGGRRSIVCRRAGGNGHRRRSLYRRGRRGARRRRLRCAAGRDRLPDGVCRARGRGAPRTKLEQDHPPTKCRFGDIDAAFASAAHVVHESLWQHRGAGHSIEGRGILAEISRVAKPRCWASTQKAHDLRQYACRMHSASTKTGCAWRRLMSAAVLVPSSASMPRTWPSLPRRSCCIVRSNGLRTAANISSTRCTSATSTGRSRSRLTPTAGSAACAASLVHDVGAYALQDVNLPYNSATTLTGPYMVPALAMDGSRPTPTKRRSPRCAGPAIRRLRSPWSGCWTRWPTNSTSSAPNCAAVISFRRKKCRISSRSRRGPVSRCNMTAATIRPARLRS